MTIHPILRFGVKTAVGLFLLASGSAAAAAADHIRIGVVNSLDSAPLYLADAKNFFKDEGLDAELVHFQSAQPIAVAVASGDIDFGSTGMTAAFFNLAGAGVLKLIGSGIWDRPGFPGLGVMVSNQAYDQGVKTFADLRGHSVAITQLGTPLHYNLARVLAQVGVPLETVRVLALQSNPNVASAVTGGTADAAVASSANVSALVVPGNAKLIGWLVDALPIGQADGTFTATRLADGRPDTVKHFLAAFRHAEQVWDAAFEDPDGKRHDQAGAEEMIAIMAKAISQPPAVIKLGVSYFEPQARVSPGDVQRMVDWYEAQGMLKGHIDAKSLIDRRYAIEVPAS